MRTLLTGYLDPGCDQEASKVSLRGNRFYLLDERKSFTKQCFDWSYFS